MINAFVARTSFYPLIALSLLPCSHASASVTFVPFGSVQAQVDYGAAGTAGLTAFLSAPELGSTYLADQVVNGSLLKYIPPSASGEGTGLMRVTYAFRNDDSAPFGNLRFILNVEPNGNTNFLDTASVTWGPAAPGDPDHYAIAVYDDSSGQSLMYTNIENHSGVDDSADAACINGSACDVDTALQWDLLSLAPGETWEVTVGFSDDGSILPGASRFLQTMSFPTPDSNLTISGTAVLKPVPLPAPLLLLGSALVGLLGLFRQRGGS